MKKLDFGSGYNPQKDYLTCDFTFAPFLDYVFDGSNISCKNEEFVEIRCKNVIHHISDIESIIKEFNRCLKINGILEIIEVNELHYVSNLCLDILWYRYVIPRYEIKINLEYIDYSDIIIQNGFELTQKTISNEKELLTFKKVKNYGTENFKSID
jgi:ubiquinone/menaquinone biosynthesis C-methylase UbiE